MNTLLARSRQLSPSTPTAENACPDLDMVDSEFELVVRQSGCATWAGANYVLGAGRVELAAIKARPWRSRVELSGVCTYYQGMAIASYQGMAIARFENATPDVALPAKISIYGFAVERKSSDRVPMLRSIGSIDLTWISHITKSSEILKDAEIGQMMAGVISAIENLGDDFIVGVISKFKPSEMSNEAMIAILRASLPLRTRRAEWSDFFLECVKEVKRRDRDPSKLFRGLSAA